MRERTSGFLWAAGGLVLALATTHAARANTVDVVHDGFGAYDVTTFWAGGYDGYDVSAGVYMLNKTADTGTGSTWHNGSIPGFCVELHETAPTATHTYDVVMPEDMYNSYTGEHLGTTKANYLRELWARYYDSAWTSGSYTAQDNRAAEAFAAAAWEIVYEDMPHSAAEWDVTTDGTSGVGGFRAQDLDWETANKWLQSLTGGGAKADLRVFVCDGQQNYLVAVPEPATLILLGLGGLCGLRRKKADRAYLGREKPPSSVFPSQTPVARRESRPVHSSTKSNPDAQRCSAPREISLKNIGPICLFPTHPLRGRETGGAGTVEERER